MPATRSPSKRDPRAWLSGPALDLYQHLDALGEIRRLQQMPQLGALAWVRPEARHSRWDYVELVLRLAARIAPLDSLFEEFGKVEIEGHWVGAGRDLLQCWVLLVNSSRLWGGMATERVVLDVLANPGRARDLFLAGFRSEADLGYARWVLDHFMLYRMGRLLATGFMHALPERREAPGRPMWLAMLRAFCEHGRYGSKILQLHRAYEMLCRLARLHLDLACAHLPVALDISTLERDPARYLSAILVRESGPLHALLDSISHYIRSAIYLHHDAVLATGLLRQRAGPRVRERLNAARSPEQLFGRLSAMRSAQAWPEAAEVARSVRGGEYLHLHRVAKPLPKSLEPKAFWAQTPRVQSRLTRRVGSGALVHVAAGNLVAERVMDFFLARRAGPEDLARMLCVVREQMAPRAAPQGRRGPEVGDLALRLLSIALRPGHRLRTPDQPEQAAEGAFVLVAGRGDGVAREEIESLLRRCGGDGRRRQLELLRAALPRSDADCFRVVMLNGFQVHGEDGDASDGAAFGVGYLEVNADGAALCVIEAADGSGDGSAVSALRGRLRRVGWLAGARVAQVAGGAEAVVPLRVRGQPARQPQPRAGRAG